MSKKKFKAGLESLFGDSGLDDQLPGIRPLLVEEKEAKETTNTKATKRPKRRSSKNFTTNLEDLFHSALDKEYEDRVEKSPLPNGRDTRVKKRSERPIIGIDALIRRTSEENRADFGKTSPLKKRVTFTLEKKKIEQLKSIAKSKKAYLKDIMDDIVSKYLNDIPDEQPPPSAN